MSGVYIYKLVTGEEIIGTHTNAEATGYISLKNVQQIVMQPKQGGGIEITFIPWMSLVEGDVQIKTTSIMVSAEPKADVLNHYQQAFSDVVLPPPKKLITG